MVLLFVYLRLRHTIPVQVEGRVGGKVRDKLQVCSEAMEGCRLFSLCGPSPPTHNHLFWGQNSVPLCRTHCKG